MSKEKDLSPRRNAPKITTPTGGNPARPSNAAIVKYIPDAQHFAAGREVHRKFAQMVLEARVKLAEREIRSMHKAAAEKAAKDMIPGGLADYKKPQDFDQKALAKGIEHELEHTSSRDLAEEIAMDHLVEDPEYYSHLDKMEEQYQSKEGQEVDWSKRLERLAARRGETLEELEAKVQQRIDNGVLEDFRKMGGEEREPQVDAHQSAPSDKMRPRAEMVLFDEGGVWMIDKGDYLLFPGGGVDDGEQPRDACIRETLEEANRHPINVSPAGVVESVWPENSGNEFWDGSEFDGERTYFFTGVDAGDAGITHDDLEDFQHTPFSQVAKRLQELIADESQTWARRNNEERLRLVRSSAQLARTKRNLRPIKQAQAAIPQPPQPVQPPVPPQPAQPTPAPQAPAAPQPPAAPMPTDTLRQQGDPDVRAQDFVANLAAQKGMAGPAPTGPTAPPKMAEVVDDAQTDPAVDDDQAMQPDQLDQLGSNLELPQENLDVPPPNAQVGMIANNGMQPGIRPFTQNEEQFVAQQRDAELAKAAQDIEELISGANPSALLSSVNHQEVQTGAVDPVAQASTLISTAQNSPVYQTADQQHKGLTGGVPVPNTLPKPTEKKLADAPVFKPLEQHLMFTPEGRVVARRLPDRRFAFPTVGSGRPAPYEPDVFFAPESGVPEEGVHGYRIGLRVGDLEGEMPEGFEAVDPNEALRDFYASMGLAANRPYQQLDRARARAIVRFLKRRRKQMEAAGGQT